MAPHFRDDPLRSPSFHDHADMRSPALRGLGNPAVKKVADADEDDVADLEIGHVNLHESQDFVKFQMVKGLEW